MGVIALSAVLGSLLSANLGSTGGSSNVQSQRVFETATPDTPAAAGTASASATGTPIATPLRRTYTAAPELAIDPNKQYFATIKTEKGDIRVELFPKEAPQTVNNFVFLARNDFFDGLTFHRVIDGFVAQGGDPSGQGNGGPGYSLPEEKNALKHDAGTIAMAKAGTITSGSQFYITLASQPALDRDFTVFGKVVAGMDVLQSITKRDPARNIRAAAGDKIVDIQIDER